MIGSASVRFVVLMLVATAAIAVARPARSETTMGPGLPADFPLMKGLAVCKPLVTGPEVTCEWHGVDGHAVYTFYHDALPKAGYTLLPGADEIQSPREFGAIGFKKGDVQGAVTVTGSDVQIQVITGQ